MASTVRSARRRAPRPSVVLTWLARSLVLFVAAIVAAFVTRQRTPMVVAACLSGVLLLLGVVWSVLIPCRATRVLLELGAGDEDERPRVRRLYRHGPVWHVAWRMPVGVTVSGLIYHREAIEQALDVSADFWYERGLVHMRAGTKRLPKRVEFARFYGLQGR
jgi:hypothetical protein